MAYNNNIWKDNIQRYLNNFGTFGQSILHSRENNVPNIMEEILEKKEGTFMQVPLDYVLIVLTILISSDTSSCW